MQRLEDGLADLATAPAEAAPNRLGHGPGQLTDTDQRTCVWEEKRSSRSRVGSLRSAGGTGAAWCATHRRAHEIGKRLQGRRNSHEE